MNENMDVCGKCEYVNQCDKMGYCDECGKLFKYHDHMVDGKGVLCNECTTNAKYVLELNRDNMVAIMKSIEGERDYRQTLCDADDSRENADIERMTAILSAIRIALGMDLKCEECVSCVKVYGDDTYVINKCPVHGNRR